jgi:hypothetical protein
MIHGWMPSYLPWGTAVYWSSLTVLDPTAAALLFVRPRTGVVLTAMIIVSDVIHNLWFMASHPHGGSFEADMMSSPFMISQIAFLVFVAATARLAWRSSASGVEPSATLPTPSPSLEREGN